MVPRATGETRRCLRGSRLPARAGDEKHSAERTLRLRRFTHTRDATSRDETQSPRGCSSGHGVSVDRALRTQRQRRPGHSRALACLRPAVALVAELVGRVDALSRVVPRTCKPQTCKPQRRLAGSSAARPPRKPRLRSGAAGASRWPSKAGGAASPHRMDGGSNTIGPPRRA